ncbi:MAG: heme biosynthesis HemY N-terminal domain-containing protein [Alphaproteobacteria bacterium]
MFRAILIFVKIGIIVTAGILLTEYPGEFVIDWQGWRIESSLVVLALAVVIAAILIAMLTRLVTGVLHAPKHFIDARRSARRERGYKALTQGLVAVAAGDTAEARKQSKRAEALISDPPLTRLLAAQTAQLDGKTEAAHDYFTEMLQDPNTAFLGIRGLLTQALNEGDLAEARRLTEQANKLRPGTPWVVRQLIDLQRRERNWGAAVDTVAEAIKRKSLPESEAKPLKATLLMAQAQEKYSAGLKDTALKLATEAHKLDVTLISATAMMARLLAEKGKQTKAAKLIEECWARTPDPVLARAFADVAPPGTDDLAQVRRFETLLSLNPGDPESHMALAEASLKAGLWGEARNHLSKVMTDDPEPRLCRLMAMLEESEHGDLEAARQWLAKASGDLPAETEAA